MMKKSILDPGREDYRQWKDKKQDKDPNRVRTAVMIPCTFCPMPIGPDELLFDFGERPMCLKCAKRFQEQEKQDAAKNPTVSATPSSPK